MADSYIRFFFLNLNRNSSDDKYSMIIQDLFEYLHTRAESNEICLCQEATMVC